MHPLDRVRFDSLVGQTLRPRSEVIRPAEHDSVQAVHTAYARPARPPADVGCGPAPDLGASDPIPQELQRLLPRIQRVLVAFSDNRRRSAIPSTAARYPPQNAKPSAQLANSAPHRRAWPSVVHLKSMSMLLGNGATEATFSGRVRDLFATTASSAG